jgi:hypothetical protein
VRRLARQFVLSTACVALALGVTIEAQFHTRQTLELDFTLLSISTQAKWSVSEPSPNRRVGVTAQGLGFDGDPAGVEDLSVESAESLAVGSSWRPIQSGRVEVEVEPRPKEIVLPNGQRMTPYLGRAYVRYSPDTVHWSSWQVLENQPSTTARRFAGEIAVSSAERRSYASYVSAYSRLDVPWGNDEEAAVKWILQTEPDFFSKQIPFIGYVQVRFETPIHGGQRLERLSVSVSAVVSGLIMKPLDPAARDGRDGPWRFRGR